MKEASRRISETSIKMIVLGRKYCSPFADEEEEARGSQGFAQGYSTTKGQS